MESQRSSGSTGGGFGDGSPRLTQRHSTTESDFAEKGSQLEDKKCRRENEGSPRAGDAENADEAGPETIEEETIPKTTIENDIQQRLERLNDVSRVLGVVATAKFYITDASTTFEEEILKLQDEIESLKNADIDDEETNTVLREARDILEKLQPSAWPTSHEQDGRGC